MREHQLKKKGMLKFTFFSLALLQFKSQIFCCYTYIKDRIGNYGVGLVFFFIYDHLKVGVNKIARILLIKQIVYAVNSQHINLWTFFSKKKNFGANMEGCVKRSKSGF